MDYWNHLGWTDRFSQQAFSKRQKIYAKTTGANRLVTPQFVVDNEFTSRHDVIESIRSKGNEPSVLDISIEPRDRKPRKNISFSVRINPKNDPIENLEQFIVRPVLYQEKATVNPNAGENRGRKINEFHAVRKTHSPIPLKKVIKNETACSFITPENVNLSNLGLAVLVENKRTIKTIEAADRSLGEK